jgi:8-oxo-dGTP pyrophosphatase MutT (NUDIX family)
MKHHLSDSVNNQASPWKTVSSEVKYENAWIRVREDQVIRPDGKPGIYGVVEPRVAVGVVAMTPEKEIYLVGQYRYPTKRYSWELIEGGADKNEDPLDAIKRELGEEAGLEAKNWKLLSSEIQLSNCYTSELAYIYLATEISVSNKKFDLDPTEVLEVRKIPLIEATEMVRSGEISDALSMIGIFLAEKAAS